MKTFAFIPAVLLCLSINLCAAAYSGGAGTSTSPYQIATKADLLTLTATTADYSKYFILTADIDLDPNLPGGQVFTTAIIAPDTSTSGGFQGTKFTGTFNGNNHIIYNATINTTNNSYIGLFGYVGSGGQISNLILESVNITGGSCIGSLVGYNTGTVINECYANGTITGGSNSWYVGGLVGYNSGCTIDSCSMAGSIIGGSIYNNSGVGGLVGHNENCTITDCYTATSVTGNGFFRCLGGLIGENQSSDIRYCCATGPIYSFAYSQYAGGLIGDNYLGTVNNCYATGAITGNTHTAIGGLIGRNHSCAISNCYSTGSLSGENIGGLICSNDSATISYCYAAGLINALVNAGGLIGYNTSGIVNSCFWDVETSGQTESSSGKGLTTNQMKSIIIYQNAGWVDKGWVINDGIDYPRLAWQNNDGLPIPQPQPVPLLGNGSELNPYQIWTPIDLSVLSWHILVLNKHITLMTDLNMSGVRLCPIGDLGPFTGIFEGNGHVVSNISINMPGSDYVGLFGYVGSGGQIRNLGLQSINIIGNDYVGGLIGYNSGSIINCYTTGLVRGINFDSGDIDACYLGGLIGCSFGGSVSYCHATSQVIGDSSSSYEVGGLIGQNEGAVIYCYATGYANGFQSVGGLIGENSGSTVSKCYSTGSVSGYYCIGGLAGYNYTGTIMNCYATGVAGGSYTVGGLAGWNNSGVVNFCYSTGLVNCYKSIAGGLIGNNQSGSIANSFWNTQTSGQTTSSGGTGKTTVQMKTLSTFTSAGWDFTAADGDAADWMMLRPDEDYPRLVWQTIIPGDIAGLYGVNMADYKELSMHWRQTSCPAGCENADINADGTVDTQDLLLLAEHWMEGI